MRTGTGRNNPPGSGSIGIDARALRRGPAGIATYVANLLDHLPELSPVSFAHPRNNLLWNQSIVPFKALTQRWQLYHAPGYTGPLFLNCPLVVTAPDVSYLVNPAWYPHSLGPLRLNYYRASLQAADRIIVTSEFSRDELVRVMPALAGRIRCTHLAASPRFRKDPDRAQDVTRRFRLPKSFMLHVGDIHCRRNIPLLQAVSQKLGIPLVLVGRILRPREIGDLGQYHYQGLSLEDLIGFYSAASVLVYASIYEGFGLPLLEAFSCKLPVVAVRRSCVPEVCGNAALIVEPELEAFASAVEVVLEKSQEWVLKGTEQLRKFSWEKTALATRAIYQELLD